eukprot:14167235-Alexandrium_andersonii.AAC.1
MCIRDSVSSAPCSVPVAVPGAPAGGGVDAEKERAVVSASWWIARATTALDEEALLAGSQLG